MITYNGSQARESLKESGMFLLEYREHGREAVLQDIDTGKKEIWCRNDHHAGYTIDIDGVGYEFVTEALCQ